jgi:hypothetical protein
MRYVNHRVSIRFNRKVYAVNGLMDAAGLTQVEGMYRPCEGFFQVGDRLPLVFRLLNVRGPLINEGNVSSFTDQVCSTRRSDHACTDDGYSLVHDGVSRFLFFAFG